MTKSYNVADYYGTTRFQYEENAGNPIIQVSYNPDQGLFRGPKEDWAVEDVKFVFQKEVGSLIEETTKEDSPHKLHPHFLQKVLGQPPKDGFYYLCSLPVYLIQDLISSNQKQDFYIKGWDMI